MTDVTPYHKQVSDAKRKLREVCGLMRRAGFTVASEAVKSGACPIQDIDAAIRNWNAIVRRDPALSFGLAQKLVLHSAYGKRRRSMVVGIPRSG